MTATVRVVGAPRSGVTSLAGALCDRLVGHHVVEAANTTGPPPAIVIAACSAVAPLTESDCAAIDLHAGSSDVVIGVVTKVDAHRRWRDVLDANRAALAAYAPRYRDVTWVCVAAAPDVGEPNVDDLVTAVRDPSTHPLRKDLQRSTSQRRPRRAIDVGSRDELQRQRIRLGSTTGNAAPNCAPPTETGPLARRVRMSGSLGPSSRRPRGGSSSTFGTGSVRASATSPTSCGSPRRCRRSSTSRPNCPRCRRGAVPPRAV